MNGVENNMPETGKNDEKKRKQRTLAQKVGTNKLILQKIERVEARQIRIEQMQRTIFQGLSGYFKFDRPLIEKVCCESDMDLAVVSTVFESGAGILAKELVPKLPKYNLEKHKILRIVNRVNRSCNDAFGRTLIEKRGKKWAFTDFGFEIWGKSQNDLEAE